MLSIRTDLKQGLSESTGLEVYFNMPPVDANVSVPLIILEEKLNSDYAYIHGEIEIVNLQYDVSIYVDDPMQLFSYMAIIDNYCHSVGMRKTYTSGDLYNKPLWCKQFTYSCRAKQINEDIQILK